VDVLLGISSERLIYTAGIEVSYIHHLFALSSHEYRKYLLKASDSGENWCINLKTSSFTHALQACRGGVNILSSVLL
jgi:hypothetical protein